MVEGSIGKLLSHASISGPIRRVRAVAERESGLMAGHRPPNVLPGEQISQRGSRFWILPATRADFRTRYASAGADDPQKVLTVGRHLPLTDAGHAEQRRLV